MEQDQKTEKKQEGNHELPAHISHRMSVKWSTLEALRVLQSRLQAQGMPARAFLLTSAGVVQGQLADITDTYEEALAGNRLARMDVVSATVHLRADIWQLQATDDPELAPTDSGGVIHLQEAVIRVGGRRLRMDHLALFASDVVGYALVPTDPL